MSLLASAQLNLLLRNRSQRERESQGEKTVCGSFFCFSLSALSACQLQRGREVVLIPCELEPEITFWINNLQEIGCSFKSNWDIDSNAFDKHYWTVAILHFMCMCAHTHTHLRMCFESICDTFGNVLVKQGHSKTICFVRSNKVMVKQVA